MAKRPVFIPAPNGRLVDERTLEFEWFPGFSVDQKRRSIASLHQSAADGHGLWQVLEVSTKSTSGVGRRLSAFKLSLDVGGWHCPILLEAAFQGSKVFASGGPVAAEVYSMRSGRQVKQYMKRFANHQLTGFRFDGRDWKLTPTTAFYDWLYIGALRKLAERDGTIDDALEKYEAFTDIEFNPEKSLNCQARSCALYVALLKNGHLHMVTGDPAAFLDLLKARGYGKGASRPLLLEM